MNTDCKHPNIEKYKDYCPHKGYSVDIYCGDCSTPLRYFKGSYYTYDNLKHPVKVKSINMVYAEGIQESSMTPETQTTALSSLSQYTDEELLYELISRRRSFDAPYTRHYGCPHKEITVGIGKDHHATITLDEEALVKVKQRFSKQYCPY